MKRLIWGMIVALWVVQIVFGGQASGVFKLEEGEFKIGYAIADRNSETGEVRVLLAEAEPTLENRDRHLDRLEAIGDATNYRYMILTPEADGKSFNVSTRIDGLSGGGGGLYDSEIEISDRGVKGTVNTEVMNGQLELSFDAEYLAPRKKLEDLPSGGGDPGAALLKQVQAASSGDREAVLGTLSEEQRVEFEKLPADEQREALEFLAEFAPRDVRVTGGVVYDGYAIVDFEATMDGAPVTGQGLIVADGGTWRVEQVATHF